MKKKFILIALCIAMLTLLFASCKKEEQVSGGNANQNQNQSCAHSFTDGVCIHCGEKDESYNPDSDGNNDQQKPDEDEKAPVPPIDLDGETELPFVPAK